MRRSLRLLPILALGVAGALTWSAVGTVSSVGQAQEAPVRIDRAHAGEFRPDPGAPVFILVLGSDARSGNPLTARFDSIHILGINPKTRRAALVGIPRDSYVNIPGRGQAKINAALTPQSMIATVEALSGCRFDYYMVTAFEGFRRMVVALGGVPMNVPVRVFDEFALKPFGSALDLQPGKQTLGPNQALGYARSRKALAFSPRGDFDRSVHQGELMIGALRKARAEVKKNPGVMLEYLAVVRREVKSTIPLFESLRLGMLAASVRPDRVDNIVVSGGTGSAGSQSIVRISAAGIAEMRDACDNGVLDRT